jgi:hypothetical protein
VNKQSTTRTGKTRKTPPAPAAAKSVSRRKSTSSKRASNARAGTGTKPRVDSELRHAMIAQAAYFRAEKRGFVVGCELDDWFEAEREISHILDE